MVLTKMYLKHVWIIITRVYDGKTLRWFPAHFSKGMRQKVMIMCAFLVNPSLYIIDEPFVGLDPIGIKSLLDQMTERKKRRGFGSYVDAYFINGGKVLR